MTPDLISHVVARAASRSRSTARGREFSTLETQGVMKSPTANEKLPAVTCTSASRLDSPKLKIGENGKFKFSNFI